MIIWMTTNMINLNYEKRINIISINTEINNNDGDLFIIRIKLMCSIQFSNGVDSFILVGSRSKINTDITLEIFGKTTLRSCLSKIENCLIRITRKNIIKFSKQINCNIIDLSDF